MNRQILKVIWHEVLYLVLAVVPTIWSLIISVVSRDYVWFQRSGSITVLFAVFLQVRQESFQRNATSTASVVSGMGIPSAGTNPKWRRDLSTVAVWLIVFGTAIWGYGDLLLAKLKL